MNKMVQFVDSGEQIAVHTIFCIGRNYVEHAAELSNPVPANPLVFIKPLSALLIGSGSVIIPRASREVHHETEVVVLIGTGGKGIDEESALSHVAGYGIGLDVTARDIQQAAKAKAHPWTVAKGFDTFAPVSGFIAAAEIGDPSEIKFSLRVNGALRQVGRVSDMIFTVPRLISYLSTIFTLSRGDLIFTGTPAGVASLQPGDLLIAELNGGQARLDLSVRGEVSA